MFMRFSKTKSVSLHLSGRKHFPPVLIRYIEKKHPYDRFAMPSDMSLSIIADGTSVSTFLCTLNTEA